MKRFQLAFAAAALILLAGTAMAQTIKPTVILGPGVGSGRTVYHQTSNVTLSAANVYILTGIYFVDPTYTLNIPAGTLILGDSASVLCISNGATINATGTATAPIVFTSRKPIGARFPGDWGGVVILGDAPTNQVNPQIEGGIVPGSYGGSNSTHSSGTFQYVRIEYAGYRFQLNNETNGLTLGGVGSGTTIDHVQVSYAYDDGFEFFGGTVNASHLITVGETDDGFDTDFGYNGKIQFGFQMKDPNFWDPTDNSRAIETDNCGSSSCYGTNPRTNPIFSNFTLVGPKRTNATTIPGGERFDYGLMFRRGTQQNLVNSAVLGYERSMSFRDLATYNSIDTATSGADDSIRVRNTSFASFVGTVDSVETSGSGVVKAVVNSWLNGNGNTWGAASRQPDALLLTNMSSLTNPDPRPASGSELLSGTNFAGLTGFTTTTYRGAFDPSVSMNAQWGGNFSSWTNFDPQNTPYNIPGNGTYFVLKGGWNLVSLPRTSSTQDVSTIFPSVAGGNVFEWDGTGYVSKSGTDALANGKGYWAFYATDNTEYQLGTTTTATTLTVNAPGWYLVGCPNGNVRDKLPVSVYNSTTQIWSTPGDFNMETVTTSDPNRIVNGEVWGYNGITYERVQTMEPGRGYWVLVSSGSFPLTITVTSND